MVVPWSPKLLIAFLNLWKQHIKKLLWQDVDPDFPFIGASPDRIFSCDCCEPACVEIKCPYSINHTTPYDNDIKLPYLIKKGDDMTLNENHGYYTQVLMQLGVTRMTHGYFMVWTAHGHFVQHIHKNVSRWNELKLEIKDYYDRLYLSTIFSNS